MAPAVITVTNALDEATTGNGVSLREAINSTNAGADFNADVTANRTGAYGSNDTIVFALKARNERSNLKEVAGVVSQ